MKKWFTISHYPSWILMFVLLNTNLFAYVVTDFGDTAVFTGTNSTQLASLDAAVGITGFLIEDFEDNTPISGLTISGTVCCPSSINTTTSIDSLAQASSVGNWDGTRAIVITLLDETVFNYAPGTNSFGIGIGDIETVTSLQVNGSTVIADMQALSFIHRIEDDQRDMYIRIDREAGDAPITQVSFTISANDGVFFDRLAVDPVLTEASVPEINSFFLLLPLLCFLGFRRK